MINATANIISFIWWRTYCLSKEMRNIGKIHSYHIGHWQSICIEYISTESKLWTPGVHLNSVGSELTNKVRTSRRGGDWTCEHREYISTVREFNLQKPWEHLDGWVFNLRTRWVHIDGARIEHRGYNNNNNNKFFIYRGLHS